MLAEAAYYGRLALGLAEYQRSAVAKDPVAEIQAQFARRDETFLRLARHVLEQPSHFYARIFQAAGASYGDLAEGVARDGLRPTMARLLSAGVYVSHEEFKGRQAIVLFGDGDFSGRYATPAPNLRDAEEQAGEEAGHKTEAGNSPIGL